MSETIISAIDFASLFEQEKILNVISPEILSGALNAIVRFKENSQLQVILKDSTSYMEVSFDAEIDGDAEGVLIEYQKLMYIFHSYSKEELGTLTMTLNVKDADSSTFVLTTGRDKIALPHKVLDSSLITDIDDRSGALDEAAKLSGLSWTQIPDKKDFLASLTYGLRFVSPDETKNNALAIYADKLVVNDRRHVFVKRFGTDIAATGMIPIHKKIAKILTTAAAFDEKMTFILGGSNNGTFYFETKNLRGRFNNAISNVAPPNEDDLARLTPAEAAFTINTQQLLQTSTFFSGLYSTTTTTSEWNPITWEAAADGKVITLKLKDSGVIGYNSCSVERELTIEGNTPEMNVTIINDSLKAFLSLVENSEKEISIQTPSATEPAMKLSSNLMDMYLAKLL